MESNSSQMDLDVQPLYKPCTIEEAVQPHNINLGSHPVEIQIACNNVRIPKLAADCANYSNWKNTLAQVVHHCHLQEAFRKYDTDPLVLPPGMDAERRKLLCKRVKWAFALVFNSITPTLRENFRLCDHTSYPPNATPLEILRAIRMAVKVRYEVPGLPPPIRTDLLGSLPEFERTFEYFMQDLQANHLNYTVTYTPQIITVEPAAVEPTTVEPTNENTINNMQYNAWREQLSLPSVHHFISPARLGPKTGTLSLASQHRKMSKPVYDEFQKFFKNPDHFLHLGGLGNFFEWLQKLNGLIHRLHLEEAFQLQSPASYRSQLPSSYTSQDYLQFYRSVETAFQIIFRSISTDTFRRISLATGWNQNFYYTPMNVLERVHRSARPEMQSGLSCMFKAFWTYTVDNDQERSNLLRVKVLEEMEEFDRVFSRFQGKITTKEQG
ncbi:hypothetical protein BJ508DRAFT_348324 [Ascobolus immersus RN42]|uniref:Uncharacterized protein n=1 Tax=Ascobolus immersus RN42 TaxID=1160509 RepID=A0A3N4I5J1_ASCIM|nr:hypothetical protein BJ508DRAFT_348324 [Ascobolus immersus RN42]